MPELYPEQDYSNRGLFMNEPEEKFKTCSICGFDLEWEDCWNGCEDGYFDGYEEDPMWYDEGDYYPCSECGGKGGWLVCHNFENHPKKESQ